MWSGDESLQLTLILAGTTAALYLRTRCCLLAHRRPKKHLFLSAIREIYISFEIKIM